MKERQNPRATANLISALTLAYMIPIFIKNFKKGLHTEDLYPHLEEHDATKLSEELESAWKEEYKKHKKYALHIALYKCFGLKAILWGILKICDEGLQIIFLPKYLGILVDSFGTSHSEASLKDAYFSAFMIIFWTLVHTLVLRPTFMGMMHHSMKMRVACSCLIYRKTLRLSQSALGKTSAGKIVNLLSNDVNRFDWEFVLWHYAFVAPILCTLGTYLIYEELGTAAFIGVAFLFLVIPLQFYLGSVIAGIRNLIAASADQRVGLTSEVITGIQVIKMYVWENQFKKVISAARTKELQYIAKKFRISGFTYSIFSFLPRICILITVVTFHYYGGTITAKKIFVLITIYKVLKPLVSYFFFGGVMGIAEINVCIHRIHNFLTSDEFHVGKAKMTLQKFPLELTVADLTCSKGQTPKPKIKILSVSARWEGDKEETLKDLSLTVKKGQHLAVIGSVGSGKSSLINMILGELRACEGMVQTTGTISYCSQDHWLFSGSVRQNILFAAEYNEARYNMVVKMCALEVDFAQFPFGDRTLVGEKGRALSGGQKARINLARCIYHEADIYLLDDPLSAVDAKVGRQLYRNCIMNHLKDKICVLVTHQLQYLEDIDRIIILDKGRIVGEGTYKELQGSGSDFAKLLNYDEWEEEHLEKEEFSHSMDKTSGSAIEEPFEEKELMKEGSVGLDLYWKYIRNGGNYFVIFVLIAAFITSQFASNAYDFYITYWVNLEEEAAFNSTKNKTTNENFSREKIIITYSTLTFFFVFLSIFHVVFFFAFVVKASKRFHEGLFENAMKATMRFYNNNPAGRILNRFSKDLGGIDENLPLIFLDAIEIFLIVIGAIILMALVKPWSLVPSIVLLSTLHFFRYVYLQTSRNVKRIEAMTRSPIFSQITSSVQGINTIRAFDAETSLIKEFDDRQNSHSSAWFMLIASKQAFSIWIDFTFILYITCIVILPFIFESDVFGGDIGLIITQCLYFSGVIYWGINQWSELENQMTSVERVLEYKDIEKEPNREEQPQEKKWPEFGKIEFKNVSLKYNPKDPYVLKNLNFTINPGERVGVCGRTGAGKSSLITALFQLYETEGSILIDGIDVTKIPLAVLRSKMSIIPQEPLLFSGTIRMNLDPFDEFSDAKIWKSLEQVELKQVICDQNVGLEKVISEGGKNFSVGQRQLFCLARAILRKTKILLLDEATANVDPHTDNVIQNTIRRQFGDCTVITIAHRLHTIMDSDRIMFMDEGVNVEFDSPEVLLRNENGFLSRLVKSSRSGTAGNRGHF